jgi:hypothetical protein
MLLQLPPGSLYWKGDADSLTKNLLSKVGNENDAYFNGTDSPVGESKTYLIASQPLIYFADFHIHLNAITASRTRVEIITYDSKVNTGAYAGRTAHGRSFLYVPVDPTTIEEYEILLRIGLQLGAKDMPPIEVPGPGSPVRQITKAKSDR